jgi:transposase
MSSSAITAIGIDVAKLTLEFGGPCARSSGPVRNEPESVRTRLRALLKMYPALHLVCEATGGCERLLVATAHSLKIPISVVEPSRVRHFAQSLGRIEKTDPVDAQVLREFGQRMPLTQTRELEESYRVLRDWVQVRDHYIERLKVEETFLTSLANPKMRSLVQEQCDHLKSLIEEVEALIEAFLQEQAPELNDRVQTLCLVAGVAARSAVGLLAYIPELGRIGDQQLSKLVGLAPIAHDSGEINGPRHIAKGRAPARRILYMLALVAVRFNEHLKPFYLRLRSNGKPPKVALIAVARKLILFLNNLLKPAFNMPV